MKYFNYAFHYIIYYIAWFACISLVIQGYVWLACAVVLSCAVLQIGWLYKIQHQTFGLFYFIGLIGLVSTLIDSLLVVNGLVIYAANPWAPYFTSPWMIALWIIFSVNSYLVWDFFSKHLFALGLLSFIGFTVAYILGAQMKAVFFPYHEKTSFIIGTVWLIALPCLIFSYEKIIDIK